MFTTNKSSKVLANKLPVYNLQPLYTLHTHPTPTVEVGSTSISIVNIVGMLPHIAAEQRLHSIYRSLALPKHTTNRITCICGADDIQRAVSLLHQPRPSRSEEAHSLWAKLLDKGVIRAPLRLNSRLQRTIFQRTASVTHTLPFNPDIRKVRSNRRYDSKSEQRYWKCLPQQFWSALPGERLHWEASY